MTDVSHATPRGSLVREATHLPSEIEVAWAAGLFEGDGNFTKRAIWITQADPSVLHRIQALFGGSLGGPYRNTAPAHDGYVRRPIFRWYAHGSRALAMAMAVYPLLSPRRQEQADRLIGEIRGGRGID